MDEKNYLFSPPTLILLLIGFIALLGFALLAIEGGRVYMERSQAQSAAEAAASAMCSDGHDLTAQERQLATLYDFSDGLNNITVNHPPISGAYAGDMDYVEVVARRSIRGGLTGLVYSDPAVVEGWATALCNEQSLTISSTDLMQD